jgi:hypothetical protein
LDKIEALLVNLTKIQSELFAVLADIPPKRSQSELEDILGIKVYLGRNYIEGGGGSFNHDFKIGEEIDISETDLEVKPLEVDTPPQYSVSGNVVVQDCAGNILSLVG